MCLSLCTYISFGRPLKVHLVFTTNIFDLELNLNQRKKTHFKCPFQYSKVEAYGLASEPTNSKKKLFAVTMTISNRMIIIFHNQFSFRSGLNLVAMFGRACVWCAILRCGTNVKPLKEWQFKSNSLCFAFLRRLEFTAKRYRSVFLFHRCLNLSQTLRSIWSIPLKARLRLKTSDRIKICTEEEWSPTENNPKD